MLTPEIPGNLGGTVTKKEGLIMGKSVAEILREFCAKGGGPGALVCDGKGKIISSAGMATPAMKKYIAELAPILCPGVKRMADQTGNPDEAQGVSIPEDGLHALIYWLKDENYLFCLFGGQVDPHNPPTATIDLCRELRSQLRKGNWWKFWGN